MGTLLGFFIPIVKWPRSLGGDWDYFGSQSLVVRSIVLFYHRLPLHDPWVMGGTDIPANPQSRIFSPAFVLDVLFEPYTSNLVFLVVYAIFGAWGAYRLARAHDISKGISLVAALRYVDSTWFSLHYSEGHLPFGDFLLLPWVLYFSLRLSKPGSLFALSSVLALFLLDGGMYPFIFSVILILGCVATGVIRPVEVLRQLRPYWKYDCLALVAIALISMAKVVPLLLTHAGRHPVREATVMSLVLVARTFFDFHQTIAEHPMDAARRFHEYGCYVGVVAVILLAWAALSGTGFVKKNRGYLLLIGVFLWTATGWGGRYNPWTLFEAIPLISNAHVQSRFLILFHLLLVLVLARALDRVQRRAVRNGFALFLVLEAIVVTNITWSSSFQSSPGPEYAATLIRTRLIDATEPIAHKPAHYFDGTKGARDTYEPAPPDTHVRFRGEPEYRGEIYATRGDGTLVVTERSPGRIVFASDSREDMQVAINANFLNGWRVVEGDASVYRTSTDLIGLDVPAGRKTIAIEYSPRYLPWVLASFVLGLALWCYAGIALRATWRSC